jgi:hypothetical protein
VEDCGCGEGFSCIMALDPLHCRLEEACWESGSLPTGSECDPASDGCETGSACFPERLSGTPRCHRWCFRDSDCNPGFPCNYVTVVVTEECGSLETEPYKLCRLPCPPDKGCDPFTTIGCEDPPEACSYDETCGILFCRSRGSYMPGEICTSPDACEIGTQCISTGGGITSRCLPFCNDSHACPSGSCTAFDPPYFSDPALGVCVP